MRASLAVYLAVLVGPLLGGCDRGDDLQSMSAALSAGSWGVFEASWPRRDEPDVSDRAHRVAQVITGQALAAELFSTWDKSPSGSYWTSAPAPGVIASYHPNQDDMRVEDVALTTDASDGVDVGEKAARQVFTNTVAQLVAEKFVASADFDFANVDLAYAKVGSAPSGEVATPRVMLYIFTALRQINGISFLNAGMRVAVHRSGRVAWIRFGGAQISSARAGSTEVPTGRGSAFSPAVAKDEALARFAREVPNGRAVWSRTMYAMPEGVTSALIEPKHLVSHVLKFNTDGREVLSRRQLLAYSGRGVAQSPVHLGPVPNPSDTGDRRP